MQTGEKGLQAFVSGQEGEEEVRSLPSSLPFAPFPVHLPMGALSSSCLFCDVLFVF